MDLEKQIMTKVNEGVEKAIVDAIGGYSSPLSTFAKEVIQNHAEEMKSLMDNALVKTIRSKEFEKEVMSAFTHKLARTLLGKIEGEVDKAVNMFRQDPVRRAKVVSAIEKIVQKYND